MYTEIDKAAMLAFLKTAQWRWSHRHVHGIHSTPEVLYGGKWLLVGDSLDGGVSCQQSPDDLRLLELCHTALYDKRENPIEIIVEFSEQGTTVGARITDEFFLIVDPEKKAEELRWVLDLPKVG